MCVNDLFQFFAVAVHTVPVTIISNVTCIFAQFRLSDAPSTIAESPFRHFPYYTLFACFLPPNTRKQFCISIVFIFFWDYQSSWEKCKQCVCNTVCVCWGAGNTQTKCIMGNVEMANSPLKKREGNWVESIFEKTSGTGKKLANGWPARSQ